MDVKVLDIKGKETSDKVTLADSIYAIEPSDHAIYLDVKALQANKRQGTHKSKERADIVGSTKKIKKQKGTGTARAGSIKSPIFRGGGRVFGPKPRNYSQKLNVKTKRLARKSALSYKVKENALTIVEDFSFENPKTKEFKTILSNLKLDDNKVLFVIGEKNDNIYLSSRNLQKAKVITADSVNTYDVLHANKLVIAKSAVEIIEKNLN